MEHVPTPGAQYCHLPVLPIATYSSGAQHCCLPPPPALLSRSLTPHWPPTGPAAPAGEHQRRVEQLENAETLEANLR